MNVGLHVGAKRRRMENQMEKEHVQNGNWVYVGVYRDE